MQKTKWDDSKLDGTDTFVMENSSTALKRTKSYRDMALLTLWAIKMAPEATAY